MESINIKLLKLFTVILCYGIICNKHVLAVTDPVYSPVNITDDNGNFADSNSTLTWASLPAGISYLTESPKSDGQMEPYMNMVRGFTNILQPNDPDYSKLADLVNGKIPLMDGLKDFGLFLIGYGICLVIGILFMIIFPIVGCCFCCCRLCGNCGGKRIQKEPKDCKCIVFTIILDLIVAGQIIAALLLILLDSRMAYSLNYLSNATDSNLQDASSFLSNTAAEVKFIADDGFNFTLKVLTRDLDNRGYLLGVPIRDKLTSDLGITPLVNTIIGMDAQVDNVYIAFDNLEKANEQFKSSYNSLSSALTAIYNTLNTGTYLNHGTCTSNPACSNVQTNLFPNFQMNPASDPNNAPSLNSSLTQLQDLQNQDMTASAMNGKKTFDDIPWKVHNDTETQIGNLKTQMSSFTDDILKNIGDIDKLTQTASIDNAKSSIKSYTSYLTDYDNFRSAGFWGVAALIVILVILWTLGLCIGPCCYDGRTNPVDRTCCSNCAGIFLMAGGGCAWIMSILMMLFVLLPFMLGYPMEKFLCDPLSDPEYKIFNFLDGPGGMLVNGADEYYMGKMIFGNGSINISLSSILEDCKANKPAFEALKLENLIDLNQITQYTKSVNITKEMGDMSTDMSSVEIMSQETEDQLNQFSSASQVNFSAFYELYSQNLTNIDLSYFESELRTAANGLSAGTTKTNLIAEADKIQTMINTGEYAVALRDQKYAYDNTTAAEAAGGTIPDQVNATITQSNATETLLQGGTADTVFKQEIVNYEARILGTLDSFVNFVLNNFQNEMGRCIPIWNLWDSLILGGICSLTMDSFNAFWFTLGMSTFFSFLAIIFSIKLAKFFRKMKYDEDEDENDEDGSDDSDDDSQPEVVNNDDEFGYPAGNLPQKKSTGPAPFVSNGAPPVGTSLNKKGGGYQPSYTPPPRYSSAVKDF